MGYTKDQKEKLSQAKALLKALGLPKEQFNDRSGWEFLALAMVRPADEWYQATSPLLPTVEIMQFIRKEYGKNYKPNSRETIRRHTLHQFEQARIIDRNRDDPKRPTNSKDNNYSLNQPILDILANYPDGDWKEKLRKFKYVVPELNDQYLRRLDLNKIPITLPDGEKVKLSPGNHNQLQADIVHEFCSRFIGEDGRLLYIGDTASSNEAGGKLMYLDQAYFQNLGIPPLSHDKLPDIVVYDERRKRLFLIEAVTSHGPISPKRWTELEESFRQCRASIVYVTAFPDRAEFRKNAANIAWDTEVWIANNPDHMIHYNGDRFLGPHQ